MQPELRPAFDAEMAAPWRAPEQGRLDESFRRLPLMSESEQRAVTIGCATHSRLDIPMHEQYRVPLCQCQPKNALRPSRVPA